METNNLAYIDEYGILGKNSYWQMGNKIGLTREELEKVDLTDERIRIHPDLIEPILAADKELQKHGYRLYLTEGYRSKELYKLVGEKMVKDLGEKGRDKILNLKDTPHATGRSVDAVLWKNGEVLKLRDKEDGFDAYFIDFYKDKNNEFQKLQNLLIKTMQNQGFKLGTKREYFHFNYEPDFSK